MLLVSIIKQKVSYRSNTITQIRPYNHPEIAFEKRSRQRDAVQEERSEWKSVLASCEISQGCLFVRV